MIALYDPPPRPLRNLYAKYKYAFFALARPPPKNSTNFSTTVLNLCAPTPIYETIFGHTDVCGRNDAYIVYVVDENLSHIQPASLFKTWS